MIKAVIFDLDNTLIDFMKMKEASISAAIDAMLDAGLDRSPDKIREGINKIYNEKGIEYQYVFDDYLKNELGKINYKILASAIVAYRKAKEGNLQTYPHVHNTLISLIKMGIRLAVVSDAPRREAWLRICSCNLQNYFDVVMTFEDTNLRKPNPKPFQLTLERLEIKPEEAIMVGDWVERDLIGAKKVGMKTVFARYGDTFGTAFSGADYEIDYVDEIIEIVKKENGYR
ncbi:MAG: TIGR02253 family HAD-type hydrolase [Candidatus Marinimicrobia bacterium]|nr:TIGR02253 family HAD-type hydrolase [Candidatus Neomarinimicrobiota bacterium]